MNSQSVFLYLHLPKTGGSTLDSIVYDQYHDGSGSKRENGYFTAGVYYMPDGFIWKKGGQLSAQDLRAMRQPDTTAIMGHYYFGMHERLDKPARYMTLLRDPIQRVRSLYDHLKYYDFLPERMSLSQFVDQPHLAEARNDQVRRLSNAAPGESCTEDDLERAMDHLENRIDFFGVTELYDASILLAQKTFGWKGDVHYRPKLVNTNSECKQSKSEELDRVAAVNQLDVALYNHAHKHFQKRIAAEGDSFQQALATYQSENQELLEAHGPSSTLS